MTLRTSTLEIVSQFLFGTPTPPTDFASDTLIRATGPTSYDVPYSEYMATAGRVARGSMSSLVDQFFRPDVYAMNGQPLPSLVPGTYTKEALALIYNNDQYGIEFSQWQFSDDVDDLAERTFVWNSTSIRLGKVEFVVDSDGTRHIENYYLEPWVKPGHPENFDLEGGDLLAQIGNAYVIQPRMDLSHIGNIVNITFSGVPTTGTSYTIDDFYDDRAVVDDTFSLLPPSDLVLSIEDVLDELWNAGTTKTLDGGGRPILYGTTGDDALSTGKASGNPYFANELSQHAGLGVAIFFGTGNDQARGGDGSDYFDGGANTDQLTYQASSTGVTATIGDDPTHGWKLSVLDSSSSADTAVNFEQLVLSSHADTMVVSNASLLSTISGFTVNALYSANSADDDTLSFSVAASGASVASDIHFYGFETIIGSDYDDYLLIDDPSHNEIRGGLGNDTIYAGAGADRLLGGAGDDVLGGGEGADILVYSEGTDTLIGGPGNDYYDLSGATESLATLVFSEGDGHDVLSSNNGVGTIRFDGIDSSEVTLTYDYTTYFPQSGPGYTSYMTIGNVLLTVDTTGDTIFIPNVGGYYEDPTGAAPPDYGYFTGGRPKLVFDDKDVGVLWESIFGRPGVTLFSTPISSTSQTALFNHESELVIAPDMTGITGGLDGTTMFDGTDGPDNIDGTPGDDHIYTGAGNDVVMARAGDDVVVAASGAGDDYYDGGSGTDTIVYSSAIQTITVDLLSGEGSGVEVDSDTIVNIENVVGGDGDDVISGSDLSNILNGGLGADTLTGREGDDYLDGGAGSDTYVWSAGDGNDVIVDDGASADVDELQFQAGIDDGDLGVSRSGDDLILTVLGNEQITIVDQFLGAGIETISFDGGPTWGRTYFESLIEGTPPTEPWVANDDRFWTTAETSVVVDFTANDVIPSGANVEAYIWANPQHGQISWNGTDHVYIPDTGFTGVDWFSYGLEDADNNGALMTPDGAFVVVHVGQTYDPNDYTGISDSVGTGNGSYFGGSSFDDTVYFTGGDSGVSGDGKDGDDIVIFDGNIADYEIVGQGEYFTIHNTATDDSFQFTNMEYISFNGTTAISLADIVANSNYDPGDTWYEPEPIGGLV